MSNILSNSDRTLSNADRRWNNTCRERAAKFLELAKRAKRLGQKEVFMHAMRGYHRSMALIRQ